MLLGTDRGGTGSGDLGGLHQPRSRKLHILLSVCKYPPLSDPVLSWGSVVEWLMPPFSPSPNPSSASPLLSWTRLSGSDLLNINSFLATHTVVLTRPINHLPGLLAEAHVSDRFSAPLRVSSSWLSTACLYWSVLYCSSGSHNICTFSIYCQQLKIKSFAWNSRFLTSQDIEDLASQRRQPHPGCRSERQW